jgi:hypothetical protein
MLHAKVFTGEFYWGISKADTWVSCSPQLSRPVSLLRILIVNRTVAVQFATGLSTYSHPNDIKYKEIFTEMQVRRDAQQT